MQCKTTRTAPMWCLGSEVAAVFSTPGHALGSISRNLQHPSMSRRPGHAKREREVGKGGDDLIYLRTGRRRARDS